jgi:hypothetical protein
LSSVLSPFHSQKVLPWYKEKIRGPNLEFEHLERELANSAVWPPLGKNNDLAVGQFHPPAFRSFASSSLLSRLPL